MGECSLCHRRSDNISDALGLCADCILDGAPGAQAKAGRVHIRSRAQFDLPGQPPKAARGARCDRCANACSIPRGRTGFCGARTHDATGLTGGDASAGAVQWRHDPLPNNCVADWVCPASGPAGYPTFTDTKGPESSYTNLAVFYEACSFDCLFCQNWQFRAPERSSQKHSAAELANAVTPKTRCICFFGGDPACQMDHALAAARAAGQSRHNGILRICWETNGSGSQAALAEAAELSLATGGCIKFDLKAWDEPLHRALCGTSNQQTLANFETLSRWGRRRPDPPLLIASTLLVPGYVDADQVKHIARFIAKLDPKTPYALLAFHPSFEFADLPATSQEQADHCLTAAKAAGLTRVHVGNAHMLV